MTKTREPLTRLESAILNRPRVPVAPAPETVDPHLEGTCGTCGLSVHLLPREAWLKPDLPTYSHTWRASSDVDHIATCVPLGSSTFAVLDWHVLSRVTGDELRVESVRGTSEADAIRRAEAQHGGSWHVTTDEEWQRHVSEAKAPF